MTVEIKEKCCCGSEFFVKDTVVFGNSAEERYKDFLKAHEICRQADSMRDKTKIFYKD